MEKKKNGQKVDGSFETRYILLSVLAPHHLSIKTYAIRQMLRRIWVGISSVTSECLFLDSGLLLVKVSPTDLFLVLFALASPPFFLVIVSTCWFVPVLFALAPLFLGESVICCIVPRAICISLSPPPTPGESVVWIVPCAFVLSYSLWKYHLSVVLCLFAMNFLLALQPTDVLS